MTRSTRNRGERRALSYLPFSRKNGINHPELTRFIYKGHRTSLLIRGNLGMDNQRRDWSDRRVHHLYSIASTSKNGDLRREALLFLGALERAGIKDAEWAMDSIKRRSKEEDKTTLS
jgi:hypothetical protein